jgi:hypothetical protein
MSFYVVWVFEGYRYVFLHVCTERSLVEDIIGKGLSILNLRS